MGSEPAAADQLEREPAAAAAVFGDRLDAARRFVLALAGTAVERGLIGPREVPRLWTRHVLNCAVVAELIPQGHRVADVGSGAGLPGVALAIARPDLDVTLIEPLQRRVAWLDETVVDLGLTSVRVHRGRAEEMAGLGVDTATARAVAGLDTLARWCVPLVRPRGQVLAIKGRSAEGELARTREVLDGLGVEDARIATCGEDVLEEPTRVVVLSIAERSPVRSGRTSGGRRRDRRAGGQRGAKPRG